MRVVAEGRAVCHSGTYYGPGEVFPFAPCDALIADGSVLEVEPAPADDDSKKKPKPDRRRRAKK